MKQWISRFLGFAVLITVVLYQFKNFDVSIDDTGAKTITTTTKTTKLNLNEFLSGYQAGVFEKIEVVDGTKLEGYEKLPATGSIYSALLKEKINEINYNIYTTNKPFDTSLTELGISLTGKTQIIVSFNERGFWGKLFMDQLLPLLFFVGLIFILFRFMGPKGGWWLPFNFKVWKLKNKKESTTKFTDVIGMEECKGELKEIVDYLKDPAKYKKVWARPPKGVLLHGAPGGGKTLLARAVAGEANVAFFTASGSEFMEMLVGMWAAKVRDLFGQAKSSAPSIIFIDEIDAIGKRRWNGHTGWHQEQEQTLNQILTEMDGFDNDTKVIVIAATNRPDTLDPALLRSGRFDRKVFVGRPTLEERQKILEYYVKDKKLDESVNLETMARRTSTFVGADLENLVNEAALKVAKDDRSTLTAMDFEYALEKVVMGPEKKIKSLKEKERNIVTYHELGHALTANTLPNADPVEKISIVSRGTALGVTWMMPEEDKYLYSKAKFLDETVTLLWWRAAEEIFFGKEEITTGASNDFSRATKIIHDLVLKYGMDEELGVVMYHDSERDEYQMFRPYSEKTAELADKKIKTILSECYTKAKAIITKNKTLIHKMAAVLLEKEYLTKEEFESLIKNPKLADDMLIQAKTKNAELQAEAKAFVEKKQLPVKNIKKSSFKKKIIRK